MQIFDLKDCLFLDRHSLEYSIKDECATKTRFGYRVREGVSIRSHKLTKDLDSRKYSATTVQTPENEEFFVHGKDISSRSLYVESYDSRAECKAFSSNRILLALGCSLTERQQPPTSSQVIQYTVGQTTVDPNINLYRDGLYSTLTDEYPVNSCK